MQQNYGEVGVNVPDRERPFWGHYGAKTKRLELSRLRKFVETVFWWHVTGMTDEIRKWVQKSTGTAVSVSYCYRCRGEAPFYHDYCLSCGERERSITTMEDLRGKETAAEKAAKEKTPYWHFGRAKINGVCPNHPEMPEEDYVLTLRTSQDKEKACVMCAQCARFMLERLLTDYYRESRKKQDVGELRNFWGNWHPMMPKEAA